MSLPGLFQFFDLECPHFNVSVQKRPLKAFLGHLNKITDATYSEHLQGILNVALPPSSTDVEIEAFAQLFFGKLCTEPTYAELYASLCRDLESQLPSTSGPGFLDAIVSQMVPFISQPAHENDFEDYKQRTYKTACFGFMSQLLRQGTLPGGVIKEVLSSLLADVQQHIEHNSRPHASTTEPIGPNTVVGDRSVKHGLYVLCKLLESCGWYMSDAVPQALAEVIVLLEDLASENCAHGGLLNLQTRFLILDTLARARNNWRMPAGPFFIWMLDDDGPEGSATAG